MVNLYSDLMANYESLSDEELSAAYLGVYLCLEKEPCDMLREDLEELKKEISKRKTKF